MTGFELDRKNTKSNLRAEFHRDDVTGREMVTIRIKGSNDTSIQKVEPHHISMWPVEYQAFKTNNPDIEIGGTPLMEIPGMTPEKVRNYKLNGVRNVEELSELSDMNCNLMGHGVLTDRSVARLLLEARSKAGASTPAPKKVKAADAHAGAN